MQKISIWIRSYLVSKNLLKNKCGGELILRLKGNEATQHREKRACSAAKFEGLWPATATAYEWVCRGVWTIRSMQTQDIEVPRLRRIARGRGANAECYQCVQRQDLHYHLWRCALEKDCWAGAWIVRCRRSMELDQQQPGVMHIL